MARGRVVRSESRARYFVRSLARQRGWTTSHVARGGDFLEENEIEAAFPAIGLRGDRPDFLVVLDGEPMIVVEAKNSSGQLDQAAREARDYVDQIWSAGRLRPRFAVGAAGEEDRGFLLETWFRADGGWERLRHREFALTSFPTRREVELALGAMDATTDVSLPAASEFIDAAVAVSALLRSARVEAPLRPKVIGAFTLALYQGDIPLARDEMLEGVNELVVAAVNASRELPATRKGQLLDVLRLSHADFDRLIPFIGRIGAVLRALNIRAVLHSDIDFLGLFYEAFLRYGYDNNALGIVFTPRHITRLCVELADVRSTDSVIDIACGTGGFLVSAFDRMMAHAASPAARERIKEALAGIDDNPTVWSLAMLNMFFRGDGKTYVRRADSLDRRVLASYRGRYTCAFLNPPFSQEEEPEYRFIDNAADALVPGGRIAAVVYAGVFADADHAAWRRGFLARHGLIGMISLPDDLFYPTAAPTTIMIARAHVPQRATDRVFMARVWNDGFAKLKGRRIGCPGSQLPEIEAAFADFTAGRPIASQLATAIPAADLLGGDEWSPQKWLPQPDRLDEVLPGLMADGARSMFQAITQHPEVADGVLADFTAPWADLPPLPLGHAAPLSTFFAIGNGRSSGEKNYPSGAVPYVSSGDAANSIVAMKEGEAGELFGDGAITVTAFGTAALQPWPFLARGNGGSSVRVLVPRFRMGESELLWFVAQINAQKWRFFYARMAIKGRLQGLGVTSPPAALRPPGDPIAARVRAFSSSLDAFSQPPGMIG